MFQGSQEVLKSFRGLRGVSGGFSKIWGLLRGFQVRFREVCGDFRGVARDSHGAFRGFREGVFLESQELSRALLRRYRVFHNGLLRNFGSVPGWEVSGCFKGSHKGGFGNVSSILKFSGSLRGASGVFERILVEF